MIIPIANISCNKYLNFSLLCYKQTLKWSKNICTQISQKILAINKTSRKGKIKRTILKFGHASSYLFYRSRCTYHSLTREPYDYPHGLV